MTFTNDEATTPIVLDVRIRDWVLFPILLVMFLVALVRQWAANVTQSERKATIGAIQERQIVARSERTRAGSKWLFAGGFQTRKAFLGRGGGILDIERPEGSQQANPMVSQGMDQGGMADAMKNQVMTVVPQLAIMGWVSTFFSGFVVITLPFVLTPRFKAMLHRGIEGAGLDFCHVSSLSWYVLNLLGLRGLTSLFLELDSSSGDSPSSASSIQSQMGMMLPAQQQQPGMGPPDIVKTFRGELENLDILVHHWDLDSIESRILHRPDLLLSSSSSSSPQPSSSSSIEGSSSHRSSIKKRSSGK